METLSKIHPTRWVVGFIVLVGVIVLAGSSFVIIEAGEVGVVSTFGKVRTSSLASGFHVKNPFSKIIRLSARTNSYTMSAAYAEGEIQGDDSIQALAKDGGTVSFDVTVLYRLLPEAAPEVYRTLGVEYSQNIIRPEIRSVIREVAARYPVNELYSTKRDEVQSSILSELKTNLEPRKIVIEDVLLRNVSVSESLLKSIGEKLTAEQEVQRQQFEIEKAKKEAERKVIEAQGQRDAQKIIDQGLSQNYLYYLYIQNLKDRQGTIYVPLNPSTGMPTFKGL
jgi:regulator of protease activity HflC (stomatin/prohibitin superfamily)